jgi:hypothetical protein
LTLAPYTYQDLHRAHGHNYNSKFVWAFRLDEDTNVIARKEVKGEV